MKWLEDQVFSIREAATKNLQQLAREFGPDWAKEHLVPQVRRDRGLAGGLTGAWSGLGYGTYVGFVGQSWRCGLGSGLDRGMGYFWP